MQRLTDRVAVVTGSSTGIGRAIAERFGREGAKVVINSRELRRAQEAVDALRAEGISAIAVEGDISRPEDSERLAQAAVTEFGGLDIWVNNAGINAIAPSLELDYRDFLRVIEVNLAGCFAGSQAAGRVMVPQGHGVILQIGSIFGEVGMPMRAAYCSAKHGLLGLTKVLSNEWARSGVRVVCLDPAYIRTDLDVQDQATGSYDDADVERRTPMGRYGTLDEVAGVALFLCSDDAGYVTGSRVTVDGGWMGYGGW
ncbi:MAG: SDR family NAD(P)-dependent oxidoreductase [Thermaerobacter sp.]|nr:SDR family NAD(P)-dependent oxidoreductase [Thermaerobacter sp.]